MTTTDPYRYFRVEAKELLENIGSCLIELERTHPADTTARMLRLAHTLKGAARVVRQQEIAILAHALEDALSPHRASTAPLAREEIDAALAMLDAMTSHLATLEQSGAVQTPVVRPSAENTRTLRADVAEVDAVLGGLTELHRQTASLRAQGGAFERARHLSTLLADTLASARIADCAVTENLRAVSAELRDLVNTYDRSVLLTLTSMARDLAVTRDAAERLRLIGVGEMFPALERTARDLARGQGKRVEIVLVGGDVRLDGHVVEIVQTALLQMVRNAVVHGIEIEAERRKRGKPAEGRLTVSVMRRGRSVVVECRDDGRGVDVDAARDALRRSGLHADGDENDVVDRLMSARISTENSITQASGRGVGLDVVREAAQRLGGAATMRSLRGRGTVVELAIPLSVAALLVIVVKAAEQTFAIPLDAVRSVRFIAPGDRLRSTASDTVVDGDGTLPFVSLSRLAQPHASSSEHRTVVILAGKAGRAAVGVDSLVGTSTALLRPLPELTPASGIVAGTMVDPEGRLRLVLDPDGLVEAATSTPPEPAPRPRVPKPILVIDDSLTTRMLEQSILESAGFEVHLADSAEAALERAGVTDYGLFLVDVEMPGMDGFAFVEHTRADPRLREIPAIIVSSRADPADRARAKAVGTNGYVVKSEFNQGDFLARVRALVRVRT